MKELEVEEVEVEVEEPAGEKYGEMRHSGVTTSTPMVPPPPI